MKKIGFLVLLVLGLQSCEKRYDCVCRSISKNKDTLVARVNTTKLGSKGFKEDCVKNEKLVPDFTDCRLQ